MLQVPTTGEAEESSVKRRRKNNSRRPTTSGISPIAVKGNSRSSSGGGGDSVTDTATDGDEMKWLVVTGSVSAILIFSRPANSGA